MLSITLDTTDHRDTAIALGLDDREFARAAAKAVKTTQRTLYRLGHTQLAKALDARRVSELKRRKRVTGYVSGMTGVIRLNTDPITLSALKPSTIRQVPKAFRIAKFGSTVLQRQGASLPPQYEARLKRFKRRSGQPDTIQKIHRRISPEATQVADQLAADADALLQKNITREIDQTLRRKHHA